MLVPILFNFLNISDDLKPKVDKESDLNTINIKAPLSGVIESLQDVNDIVFAQRMMGRRTAIFPSDRKIYAPFDAEIKAFSSDSKHANGLVSKEGVELLIHCDLNAVKLNGIGYKAHINRDKG